MDPTPSPYCTSAGIGCSPFTYFLYSQQLGNWIYCAVLYDPSSTNAGPAVAAVNTSLMRNVCWTGAIMQKTVEWSRPVKSTSPPSSVAFSSVISTMFRLRSFRAPFITSVWKKHTDTKTDSVKTSANMKQRTDSQWRTVSSVSHQHFLSAGILWCGPVLIRHL